MRALTLYPEWAWAICALGKRIENRTWIAERMVGHHLCIHGGKNIGGHARRDDWHLDIADVLAQKTGRRDASREDMARGVVAAQKHAGAIVAVCKVVGFTQASEDPWFVGPWGWLLDEVQVLPAPVACKGAMGLWEVPAAAEAEILAQIGGGR
jgi:hypothetical protein